jgi:hypothetical protein
MDASLCLYFVANMDASLLWLTLDVFFVPLNIILDAYAYVWLHQWLKKVMNICRQEIIFVITAVVTSMA